jgi:acylphosphatase
MKIARRYLIGGRVQGVGFRYFTYEAATREGVCGWVRNRADGRVEAWVEGDAEAVLRFEERLRRGPSLSRVALFEVSEEQPVDATDFHIQPTAV